MSSSSPRPIPRPLKASMAFQYAVGGAFLPFVTLFIRDQGLGFDDVSYIHLTSAAVGSAVPFLWGCVADRWVPVDRLLILLHLGGGIALAIFSFQSTLPGLLASYGMMFALYPPTTALFNALAYHNLPSPDTQFAKLRLWGSFAWMIPSLPIFLWLALANGASRPSLAWTVRLGALLELVTAAGCCFLPRTPPAARSRAPLQGTTAGGTTGTALVAPSSYSTSLKRLLSRPGFIVFLCVIFLMHSSFAILFYYSPPALEAAGFERKWIGPLQCLGVLAEVPFLFALPWVIRRFGYHATIVLGCITLLLRQIIYASPSPPWLLAASYVFAGTCVAFYLTAVSLALNSMAEGSVRATAQTFFALTGPGLGQMFGHLVVGRLASAARGGLASAFTFASVTAGLALFLLYIPLRRKGLFSGSTGSHQDRRPLHGAALEATAKPESTSATP